MGAYRRLVASLRSVRQCVGILQVTARAYRRQVACALIVTMVALAAAIPSLVSTRSGNPIQSTGDRQAQQAAPSGGLSHAGRWEIRVVGHCERNLANIGTCDSVLGAGIVTANVTMEVVSDAQGRFTFQAQRLYAGKGSGTSPQCNAGFEDAVSVTGVCRETARGRGAVADLGAGLLFYISEEWVTFYGQSVVRAVPVMNPGPYLADAPVPAVPGDYDTTKTMSFLGLNGPLLSGVQLAMTVRAV